MITTGTEDAKRKKVVELRELVDSQLNFAATSRDPVDERVRIKGR